MKRLFNKFSHGGGLRSCLPLMMLIVCSILGTTDAWASTTYYAKVTAKLSTKNESGSGKVYASTTSTANASVEASAWKTDANGSSAQNSQKDSQVTLYINAMANPGYVFKGWSKTDGNTDLGTASPYTVNSGTSNISTDSRTYTECGPFYARFVPFTFGNATPASVTIADAYAKHTYEGAVVIETNEATAVGNFNTPTITTTAGSGTFTYVSQTWAGGNLTINYRFNANGFVGTTRATLTAKTAGDVRTKDIALTATTVAPTITAENPTQLTPSTPTAVAEGTATFNVTNAEDASYFAAPTFTNVQGGGTWTIVSSSYSAGVYTVNYSFQSDAEHLGDHSADLTLTATVGSAKRTVTATAFTEALADYDVEVFNKSGVSIHQGDWATAVTKANANEGSTIKLCRNVDLGVLSTHGANITVNTTLDLAGKTLSATCNATSRYTIYLTKANKTLTITDSKNGGTIRTIGAYNNVIYCVGASAGSIVMNGGTISLENTMTYASGSSIQTRAVQIAANANFTLNDGEIIAEGGQSVYGIRKEGSATATGEVHINGGTINANCKRQYAYGIYTLGKLYVDGGTINAKTYTGTGTTDAYGIDVAASANMNAASEYMGELFMTDGVVTASTQTSGAYAVYVVGGTTQGTKYTDDGTYYLSANRRAYPSQATISGGTFNAETTTSGAYGLFVSGSVRSVADEYDHTMDKPTVVTGGTFNATATTSGAYGIYAQAESSWAFACLKYGIIEVSNVTCNAKTGTSGAYGAYVNVSSKRWAEGAPSTSWNASYPFRDRKDEYTVAAKMTIHSGTFIGTASTTGGCGVYSATRAIALSGDYDNQAYPELIINGGTFVGKTEGASATKTAYGLYSGGYTTVTGGEFTALPNTTDAFGAYVNAGKLTMSNATLTATSTVNAYGVYVNAGVADVTGVETSGEAELNNLDVTATTTTGNEADGVRIVTAQRTVATGAEWNRHPGEYVCAGKATINGGSYNVTAAGTTAYGVCLNGSAPTILGNKVATGETHIKNASFVVKTKGTTTAYGVYAGGLTSIENCTFDVAAQTTTAYGIYAQDKECSVKNSTFTVNAGGNTAYGIYANASLSGYMRIPLESRVVSSNNKFTVVSGGTPAYGVYAQSTKVVQNATTWAALSDADKTTYPYPDKYAYGEWAVAAEVSLENDEFDVTAVGATARTIYTRGNCKPTETSEVSAMAKVTIDGGKYKATAATTQQDVFNETPRASDGYYPPEDGEPILIKGGFFKNEANLNVYKMHGVVVNELKSGEDAEYAEGYRFEVGAPRFGAPVCKNVTANKEYLTLEAALEDVNNGTVNGGTIVMMLPYTLPAGNYKIPSGTTLLIPHSDTQTAANGTEMGYSTGSWYNLTYHYLKYGSTAHQAQFQNVQLTLAEGAHIDVYGIVEPSALMYAKTANAAGSAVVWGGYGQIQMDEGSSMSIEPGASLQAWGYITGKGEITVHRGAYVYEMFQTFDWKGGSNLMSYLNDMTNHKVFPVNQYYIQNIESPVIYRPGSHLLTSMYVDLSDNPTGCDNIGMIGEWRSSDDKDIAMFLMDAADMSDDTWVRKEYDPVNDVQLYTVNSAAMVSSVKITASNQTLESKNYDLPLTNNFKIRVQSGKLDITENVVMLPGAEIEVMKEASLDINTGKRLVLYDKDQWNKYAYNGAYIKPLVYSPSWKTCPRANLLSHIKDASINVRASGKIVVNGALYTTEGGANIHSSNEEAGYVIFPAASPATNTNVYQWWEIGGSDGKTKQCVAALITSAQLANEDGTFTTTTTACNDVSYAYSNGKWQCWEQVGCYQVDKTDDANWKWYANPSDFVQVKSNETDNHVAPVMDEDHLYPNTDETRFFILMDNCIWWEVSLVDEDLCYSEMNDTYYQWDGSKWVIKSFTITWKDWNGTTLDTYNNAKYKSMPKWLSATPTKAKQAGDPAGSYYIFSGWTPDLDIVTENTTYTATYELIVPKYDVHWKNEDGSKTLHISRWAEGEHPAYDGAEIKKATSMVGVDLAHNGWSTAANGEGTRYGLTDELPAMGAAAQTYYATFAEGSIISWLDENGNLLDKKLWAAGTRPTHANINKESDAQYDYVFAGWTPEILPVEADAEYTAVFTPVLRQYAITFSNLNGKGSSQVINVDYGATPVCPVTPDRGNSAEYSYEWTGWKDAAGNTFGTDYVFPAVSGDATYTATFLQTTRTYTVTWKNEDGSVLERVRGLAFGDAVPDYSGTTPEKEPTRYLTYGFAGWTPAKKATIDESGDQEYRATYDAGTTRYYTVRWLMDNGDLIDETNLEYDQMPTHADPTKASTALYSYDFAGWTPAISAVKGDAEYKAIFNAIHRQYEITYVLYDDVKNVVRYQAEDAVAVPANPTREGYTFVRWDKAIPTEMPAEDVEITAIWTINQYDITWKNADGTTLTTTKVNYNEMPSYTGTTPTKTADAQYTYTFNGWTPAIAVATKDATYTATYNAVEGEAAVVAGSVTTAYATFADALSHVTAGNTLKLLKNVTNASARDLRTAMTLDLNGKVLTTGLNMFTVRAALTITDGGDGTGKIYANENNSGSQTYVFLVSSASLTINSGTIEAHNTNTGASNSTYSIATNSSTVTMNGGRLIVEAANNSYGIYSVVSSNVAINGGEIKVQGGSSCKAYDINMDKVNLTATNGKFYVANSATKAAFSTSTTVSAGYYSHNTNVVAATGYVLTESDEYAGYDYEIAKAYKVTFKNGETVLQEGDVKVGAMPAYTGAIPTKDADAQYTYTFSTWSPAITAVSSADQVYTAQFNSALRSYTIIWQDEEGNELSREDVHYGDTPSHADLTKDADAQYTYTWKGWNNDPVAVTGPATYKSLGFTATPKSYTLAWNLNGGEVTTAGTAAGSVAFGTSLTAPTVEKSGYTFNGWDPTVPATMPAANATYTAQWRANSYTITFITDGGTEIAPISGNYGDPISAPADPTKTGYDFAGWDAEIPNMMPADNMEITAIWTPITYTITYEGLEGASNSNPTNYTIESETINFVAPGERAGYTFNGWSPASIATGSTGNKTVTASWTINELPLSEDIVATSTVIVSDSKKVNNLTISENGSVTIADDAQITVVENLYLEATPDNNMGAVLSGNFEVQGNAFIDINMNGSGTMNKNYYYSFAVPFSVNVNGGVYRMEGSNAVPMVPGTGFLAYKYNEATRAEKGTDDSAWEMVSNGTFEPGVFYLILFSSNKSNTYRFQWNGTGSLNNHADIDVTTTGNDAINSGWHGVANNGLGYTTMSGDFTVMQTLNSEDNAFESFTVGQDIAMANPVFVQMATGTIDLSTPTAHAAAPRRVAAERTELMNVRLTRAGADKHDDQIFFSASEEAENQYTLGRDVAKMFMGQAKTAQLWINAYGENLVANEALLNGNTAHYPLGLYAPQTGDYVISVNGTVSDNIYLLYQGMPVWNLSLSEYSLHLEAGDTEDYEIVLLRAPQITTDMENVVEGDDVQKILYNDKLFIIRGEHVFDGMGKMVK